ncbi:MAG: DUF4860 domain-containing protein [Eubacterium sp.]|nr:DUF4860 domain-containing protein [Eubacterium sp.]
MGRNKKYFHHITFLFPLLIFGIFSLLAVTVVLFAARGYERSIKRADERSEENTAIAYVREKIRQNDEASAVSLEDFDGQTALCLTQSIESGDDSRKVSMHTYIYPYDGNLCELSVMDKVTASPEAGTPITPVRSFEISRVSDSVYKLTCAGSREHSETAYITAMGN